MPTERRPVHRFTFGPMGVGKSAHLIAEAEQAEAAGTHVIALVPASAGRAEVRSRNGSSRPAAVLADGALPALDSVPDGRTSATVFVDDVHMLDADHLRALVAWADDHTVALHVYGLLLDFRAQAFPAAIAALESVDEAVALAEGASCWCGAPATRNGRLVDGSLVRTGPAVIAGPLDDEPHASLSYVQLCRTHWAEGRAEP